MKRRLYLLAAGSLILLGAVLARAYLTERSSPRETTGRVVGFGTEGTIYLEHGRLSDRIGLGTSPFRGLDSAAIGTLKIGDAVGVRYRIARGEYRIAELTKLLDNAIARHPAATEEKGTRNGARETIEAGEPVPDLRLVDQRAERTALSAFHGRILVLTFIYTSCPVPDFCPLMSERFATLQSRFREAFGKEVHLLSISFDPKNDTPEVLREYAARYTDDLSTWTFAAPAGRAELEEALRIFGISSTEKGDEIVHNLVTAIIDPDGRLVWRWLGNDWTPDDVFAVTRQVAERNPLIDQSSVAPP